MYREYLKMALTSIRASKVRSALTMFGIIVGISSVVTIVSLGEGVKRQVGTQVNALGDNLIVVRPGKLTDIKLLSFDALGTLSGNSAGSLSEQDWLVSEKIPNVSSSTPVGLVAAIATYDNQDYSGPIVATTHTLPAVLNQKVEFGQFFDAEDSNKNYAVIGRKVAEQLFKENVPIGKTFRIRDSNYIVQGIFEQQPGGILAAIDTNSAIIIPYETAKKITSSLTINQILVRTTDVSQLDQTATALTAAIRGLHSEQEDFSVLKEDEAVEATNQIFYQLTVFIAGVALISLLVGGIGIMNIMFATVSERTREIGVRKALGATNQQLLGQFVMEAVVLSVIGGFIGIILSFIANALIRIGTNLQPVTTWEVVGVVFVISVAVGVVSGLLPAAKAARKDPIESLRYSE